MRRIGLFLLLSLSFIVAVSQLTLAYNPQTTQIRRANVPRISAEQAQQQTASWTYLVYMAADNDLESFALSDLNEMEFAGSSDRVNIIVQVDRAAGFDKSEGDWQDARRYRIDEDFNGQAINSTIVEEIGEVNMGDPDTLIDFATWGIENFPAERYALVIWDHGGSWYGVANDDSANGDGLTLPELREALMTITTTTEIEQFDFLGFDACLMGAIEVYDVIAPFGRYAVASAELIPGQGWDYNGTLFELISVPDILPSELGRVTVENFTAFYDRLKSADYYILSSVDLSRIGALESALDDFALLVESDPATYNLALTKARSEARVFGSYDDPTKGDVWSAVDIQRLMDLLLIHSDSAALTAAAQEVKTALDAAILTVEASDVLAQSGGISIFFPDTATTYETNNRSTRYTQTTVDDFATWRGFLQSFYSVNVGTTASIEVIAASIQPNATGTGDGEEIVFDVAVGGLGLIDAALFIELEVDGGRTILVEYERFDVTEAQDVTKSSPELTTTTRVAFSNEVPMLTDETSEVPTLVITSRNSETRGVVYGTYIPQTDDPDVESVLVIDVETGLATALWGIRETEIGPMPYEIIPQPGDNFLPAWAEVNQNELLLTDAPLTLTFTEAPLRIFYRQRLGEELFSVGTSVASADGTVSEDSVAPEELVALIGEDIFAPDDAADNISSNGVAVAVAPDTTCQPNAAFGIAYVIQPDDTLFDLASALGVTIDALATGNCLDNPDLIVSGQTIFLPAPLPLPATPVPTSPPENPVSQPPPATGNADLSMTVTTTSTNPVNEGDTILYDFIVINNGPDTATNVVTSISLTTGLVPAGIIFSSGGGISQGTYDETSSTWFVGTLAPGASAAITGYSAQVSAGTAGMDLSATLSSLGSDQADSNSSNDIASVILTVINCSIPANVTTEAELIGAMERGAGCATYTINLQANINISGPYSSPTAQTGTPDVVSNITIIGGGFTITSTTPGYRGFIIGSGGNLILQNITISNFNNTAIDGGGFFIQTGGTLNMDNVTVSDNRAANGGAVYVDLGGELNVIATGAIFARNIASINGGAIATATDSRLQINPGTFTNNEALEGAALYVDINTNAQLTNLTIINNGSIPTPNSTFYTRTGMTLDGLTLNNNGGSNAAFVVDGSNVTITNSIINNPAAFQNCLVINGGTIDATDPGNTITGACP